MPTQTRRHSLTNDLRCWLRSSTETCLSRIDSRPNCWPRASDSTRSSVASSARCRPELGARWAAGDIVVADEHAASAAVEDLIIRLGATVEAPTGPAVVVAAAERDTHALGARVVASALSLDGFRVLFLGASVPAEDLRDYLEVQQPLALALSCSIGAALSGARRCVAVAHEVGIPVVCGGRALSESRAQVLGADALRALAARRGRPTPDVVARGTRATRPGTAAGTGAAVTRGSQSPPHRDRTGSGAER